MALKVITVATSDSKGLQALKRSAERAGMDLTALGLGMSWLGFGMKILLTKEYLSSLQGYTHFMFVDAYDTLFLKHVDYSGGILFSCEKHKWPDVDAPYHSEPDPKKWQYLNSGSYVAPIKDFLDLVEANPVQYSDDDQRYFTNLYLQGKGVKLDTECKLFQSYAFMNEGDFTLTDKELINNITGTRPAVIHFNGKCLEPKIYNMIEFQTLADVQKIWKDNPETHQLINEGFISKVNDVPELKAHRDFVENHIFGFGERSFQWMWKLIVDEMPKEFTFMEIGVFKGQTLSLCKLLADWIGKKAKRYGVTPLSTEGGVWDSDYKRDIKIIHDEFKLKNDYTLIVGLSEDPATIEEASKIPLDILYIDGGHEERHITNDIDNYAHLVKPGGYLVIDDCCNSMRMPFGYFQGIEPVTKVVDDKLPLTGTKDWEFILSVVHNRVYRRK